MTKHAERVIKLWGLPYSGTNYVRYVLERHYHSRVLQNILGHKHGPPVLADSWTERDSWYPAKWSAAERLLMSPLEQTKQQHDVPIADELRRSVERQAPLPALCLVKEPCAWLHSVARACMGGARPAALTNEQLRILANYWSTRVRQYMDFRADGGRATVARYEDLLTTEGIEHLAEALQLRLRHRTLPVQLPAGRMMKRGDRAARQTQEPFRAEEYKLGLYMRGFNADSLRAFNTALDTGVVQAAGYRMRSPDDLVLLRRKVADPLKWWNANLTDENMGEWLSSRGWWQLDHPQRQRFHRFMRNHKPASMLDCGGGPLLELRALRQAGIAVEYHLLEVTQRFVDMAAAEGVDAMLGSIHDIASADRAYDLVYCRHVLEHVPNWRRALSEMVRVARRFVYIALMHPLAPVTTERRDPRTGLQWNRYSKHDITAHLRAQPRVVDVDARPNNIEVYLAAG